MLSVTLRLIRVDKAYTSNSYMCFMRSVTLFLYVFIYTLTPGRRKKMVETNNDADIIKVDGGSSFT